MKGFDVASASVRPELPGISATGPFTIDHADALDWLANQPSGEATLVVFDPPYAVGSPVRGREDGAAGSVFGPLSFMSRTLAETARTLRPGGVCMIFADWRRMPDLAYIATTCGLRASTCLAWTRKRPGTGGMFRSAWDPILIASRGTPDAIDRAAIPNVVEAEHPTKRRHPYEKPPQVFEHVMARVCRPGDLVLDPFAGSGVSAAVASELGLLWRGCDIDPNFTTPPDFQISLDGRTGKALVKWPSEEKLLADIAELGRPDGIINVPDDWPIQEYISFVQAEKRRRAGGGSASRPAMPKEEDTHG